MPMSEIQHAAANPLVMAIASVLVGLALALVIYAVGSWIRATPVLAGATMGDPHRRSRRPGPQETSFFHDLAIGSMPVLLPLADRLPIGGLRRTLSARYARAGWPGGLEDDELFAMSLLIGIGLCLPAIVLLAAIFPLFAPAGVLAIPAGPALVSANLSSRGTKREQQIARIMPYALDLLVLTIRAGASLLQAMERVATDYADHPLGVEFKATLTDIELGMTSHQAFSNLGRRVPIPVVLALADEIKLAEELGRPVVETLEHLAEQARTRRVQHAVDVAGEAAVKVMVPGLLILMACLVVLFAPFIVKALYGGYAS